MVIKVTSPHEGFEHAKQWLYKESDKNTLLFLSGGSTPKSLYETLAQEQRLFIGAVALVDERYGNPFHDQSNEKMIRGTGLFAYCESKGIPTYKILQGADIQTTASKYDKTTAMLFATFPKRIVILGIGADGHIAGIAPNRVDFTNPLFDAEQNLLIGSFTDPKSMQEGGFGARITMTFAAIQKTTMRLLLAFGESKKQALLKMQKEGPIEEIPARILIQKGVSENTTILTDQDI